MCEESIVQVLHICFNKLVTLVRWDDMGVGPISFNSRFV